MTGAFKCPECGGEFQKPVDISGKSLVVGAGVVDYEAVGCPWCGEEMSETKTNVEKTDLLE